MSHQPIPLDQHTLQALIALLQSNGHASASSPSSEADMPVSRGQWIGALLLADPLPTTWQHTDFASAATSAFTQRFDMMVLVLPQQTSLSSLQRSVITKARDVLAQKLLLIAPQSANDFALAQDLRSLALSGIIGASLVCHNQAYQLWQYNIVNYKQVPDWLNSKFWANPENWNKYRW